MLDSAADLSFVTAVVATVTLATGEVATVGGVAGASGMLIGEGDGMRSDSDVSRCERVSGGAIAQDACQSRPVALALI